MTEEELEKRLVNWGKASRCSRGTDHVSFLYRPERSEGEAVDPEKSEYREPIDELDAELVTKAWRQLPSVHFEDKKAKVLIAEIYCGESGNIDAVLRRIRQVHGFRIFQREVDRLTEQAKADMKKAIERLDERDSMGG